MKRAVARTVTHCEKQTDRNRKMETLTFGNPGTLQDFFFRVSLNFTEAVRGDYADV